MITLTRIPPPLAKFTVGSDGARPDVTVTVFQDRIEIAELCYKFTRDQLAVILDEVDTVYAKAKETAI
jgi:hypothetical protein